MQDGIFLSSPTRGTLPTSRNALIVAQRPTSLGRVNSAGVALTFGVFGLVLAGGAYGGYQLGRRYKHPLVGAAAGAAVAYVPAWMAGAVTALLTMGSV
jgi:hypothetical protein